MTAAVQVEGISKSFGGHKVLNDVSLLFHAGEIHSVCGENGAGKSTLMKIIGGIYSLDSGVVRIKGEEVSMNNPQEAFDHGIGIVHQELSLSDNLSARQNVFANREPVNPLGFIKWKEIQKRTEDIFNQLGIQADPRAKIASLSFATRQMIEIGKILSMNVDVVILDEPTSALSERESEILFELLFSLKDQGKSIIFISHKLDEVQRISDRVTVLRDGKFIGTLEKGQIEESKIVSMMVGRNMEEFYPPRSATKAERVVLRASKLSRKGKFHDVSFSLRAGEVLGLYGLVGSGRTELALSMVGADKFDSGALELEGQGFRAGSPKSAVEKGLCYLSEDRKGLGLFLNMSIAENIISSSLESVSGGFGMMNNKKINTIVEELMEQLDVVPRRPEATVLRLSGGNQQKVLLGKWLATQPKVLIVDEPSKGVDVGAKSKIHFLLRDLAKEGMAVLMISSDLPEILGLSDRVMVMHEGELKGVLENVDLTQEAVMNVAYGKADTA